MALLKTNVSLAGFTRFKTGGPAEYFLQPRNAAELAAFLAANEIRPITILGMGSNVLIRDGGIKGLVIQTGRMNKIEFQDGKIIAGAGAALPAIANFAAARGIRGFEFMAGIPGAAAGGLLTNAGCFGGQISDVLESVSGLDFGGRAVRLSAADCGLSYRASALPQDFIITELQFRADAGDADEIRKKMNEIIAKKTEAQPTDARTAGSTFKNPADAPAWRKIKDAFPNGLKVGGARISEKHANFIVAEGDATSADIESLIRQIQEKNGLDPEIKII